VRGAASYAINNAAGACGLQLERLSAEGDNEAQVETPFCSLSSDGLAVGERNCIKLESVISCHREQDFFCVLTKERLFALRCDSGEDAGEWVDRLRSFTSHFLQQKPSRVPQRLHPVGRLLLLGTRCEGCVLSVLRGG